MACGCKNLLLALLALVGALFLGLFTIWKTNIVNPLHLHPVSLTGKTALVTGATEGIGKETARVFASWGVDKLILPVRNSKKGESLRKEFQDAFPKVKIDVHDNVDFKDLQTVRDFAKKVVGEKIDILVNNAGMLSPAVEGTNDGIEVIYKVNHLSPFLLTYLLIPALRKAPSARVVFVSSALHYFGSIGTFKYSEQQKGMQEYRPSMRYDDSKLMNVMSAITFGEHFGDNNKITFNSNSPGFVMSNIDGNMPNTESMIAFRAMVGRPTLEGAITQISIATHPALNGVTGRYFSDGCMNELCNASCFYCDKANAPGAYMNSEAYNKTSRDWLWNVSKKLTGLAD